MIKVICSDLDGTLLNDDKTLSERNVAGIKRWQKQGRLFGITSGRQLTGVRRALVNKFVPDFIVCLNGGRVQTITGQVIWNRIENAAAAEVLSVMFSHADRLDKLMVTENGATASVDLQHQAVAWGKLADRLHDPKPIFEKISARLKDDSYSHILLDELTKLPVSPSWSDRFFIEVAGQNVNKLNGLKQALENSISIDQVAAIGDYGNDLYIVKGVGCGIAVANASDQLKRAADLVTLSNNDDAIAQVIHDLLKE
ncbi:HAD-IIB family hydrolase [Lacticaseibacillus chiayiensis]|uniref:HAD-IIB family hydrolase n=1 Tax=Lacticaseibacillus chiayiensis TaxID=2100821 RepID=UPI001304F4F6|nr:HAD-IIB family hydrolase [Lacticaseibacillus chiayiensis]